MSNSPQKNRKKVRILLLSNMYPSTKAPSYGIFVKNIYSQLEEANIDIAKCVIKGQRKSRVGKLLAYTAYTVKAFFRLAFTQRTLYIHFVAHTSFPVLILSLFRRFSIVSHVHGGDVMFQPGVSQYWTSIKNNLAKRTLSLSNRVIVPSHYFSEYLQQKMKVDARSIFVSPSGGIETKRFVPVDKAQHKTLRLGYVGRLDEGKGVHTLLKALKHSLDNGAKVSLTVVGAGSEYEKLAQYVLDNELSNACSFVGVVAQRELVTYYQQFDYFVFPSELNESLGLVGLEAMSCGIPIVTTGNAGIGDYFDDQVNGFKYCLGDHQSLSETISMLPVVTSSRYQEMAKQCRLTALKFDSNLVKQNLIKDFSLQGAVS